MGQAQSQIDPVFIGIYQKLLAIQNAGQKTQMIQTILSSPEHLAASKQAGIYGHLLHYVQVVQAGGAAPLLPSCPYSTVGKKQQTTNVTGTTLGFSQQPQTVTNASQRGNEKAMNYFSACLRILGLEEEVALTEKSLKSAYKKAVIRVHPDKPGGSEKEFEAVTRAHAYLGEILRRINGGRAEEGKVEAPTALKGGRQQEAKSWEMVKPVALNPNKLDMNAFNKMFEETRIPDPEETGYGDWLKGGDDKISSPAFSGKFNRDVFNKAFEDDAKTKMRPNANGLVVQEMSLASRIGYATELGRGAREDYTVTSFEGNMAFTDLKKAYTEYNTFSHETAGVAPVARSLQEFESERKAAPAPLRDHELEALRSAEEQAKRTEEQRKLRMAQSAITENDYFERMKRLVIRN